MPSSECVHHPWLEQLDHATQQLRCALEELMAVHASIGVDGHIQLCLAEGEQRNQRLFLGMKLQVLQLLPARAPLHKRPRQRLQLCSVDRLAAKRQPQLLSVDLAISIDSVLMPLLRTLQE